MNISFPYDKIGEDSDNYIAEELFHAYQYFLIKTSNDSRWKNGDIEFEGKIFDYYFIQYSNNKSIYFEDYLPFKDFNKRDYPTYYEKYPISEDMSYTERISHIK